MVFYHSMPIKSCFRRKGVFMKKILTFLLALLMMCLPIDSYAGEYDLKEYKWDPFVKESLNSLMATYGSKTAGGSPYAVFDFDNTSSIFDVGEQFAVYQLQVMAFEITPQQLPWILRTELSDPNKDLSDLGYGKGSYNDWIADISAAYTKLYASYGPFTAAGLDMDTRFKLSADPYWKEFAAKMGAMYRLVYENESASVAYPWVIYRLSGMTEQQVYDLAVRSHTMYKSVKTSTVTWESPKEIESRTGAVKFTWTSGIQVTANIVELMKNLKASGIDVWICSASAMDVIRAAIDVWGLHDYVTGLLAMTGTLKDGKYINSYDYNTGVYQKPVPGGWIKGTEATMEQTQGDGKVTAINNTIYKEYGHGPIAGFMDSSGDFNFCTQYSSLKLVMCLNRASRKVTDGGGLISEVAVYQKEILGYDLAKANAAGDTLYILQGRDENGYRTLRASNKTMTLGSTTEKLFADADNEAQLAYMIYKKMSTRSIMDTFALKTAKENSVLGFEYGFLEEYEGYHTIK